MEDAKEVLKFLEKWRGEHILHSVKDGMAYHGGGPDSLRVRSIAHHYAAETLWDAMERYSEE